MKIHHFEILVIPSNMTILMKEILQNWFRVMIAGRHHMFESAYKSQNDAILW